LIKVAALPGPLSIAIINLETLEGIEVIATRKSVGRPIVNSAETEVGEFMVRVQTWGPVHAPAQPLKLDWLSAVAVRVTLVSLSKFA
jgi:hypothetical protein